MEHSDAEARRQQQAHQRRPQLTPPRVVALASLIAAAAVVLAIVVDSTSRSGSHASKGSARHSRGTNTSPPRGSASPGGATVPILAYSVINAPPPQSSLPPDSYVPVPEFTAQMNALKSGGWHAVTLNQLEAYWTNGTSLGPGKPIVITFDGGYASQYTNALPVLKGLGWVGVANIPATGLPPSDGGLSDGQIRGLTASGWELDTQGLGAGDLTGLGPAELGNQVAGARQMLRSRYGVPVNWFAYPGGHYDSTAVAAVRAAGFTGATTLVPGWARAQDDRLRLPRLRVAGGTSQSALLSQITSAQQNAAPPPSA